MWLFTCSPDLYKKAGQAVTQDMCHAAPHSAGVCMLDHRNDPSLGWFVISISFVTLSELKLLNQVLRTKDPHKTKTKAKKKMSWAIRKNRENLARKINIPAQYLLD